MYEKMENYKKSVVAKGRSRIKNIVVGNSNIHKPSFWKGFITGILSSLIASLLFYLIIQLIENNAANNV
jgi:hypothetical protein